MGPPGSAIRACRGCKELKLRCQSSQTDADSCDRCSRANQKCVPAGKRRRPRDRIAELESEVARLIQQLNGRNLPLGPSEGAEILRKRAFSTTDDSSLSGTEILAFLDAHVSLLAQQNAINAYIDHCFPTFPLFPLLDSNLERLRRDAPTLLFTIITFVVPGELSRDSRNELIGEAMRTFAIELVIRPHRRLEIVWSLLIAGLWFRSRTGEPHITVNDMVQLATGMAIDIGLGGTLMSTTPGGGHGQTFNPSSPLALRTWLACYVGSAALSISIRRLNANAEWTSRHEECFAKLSRIAYAAQPDRKFLHMVRGMRLCSKVAKHGGLCDPAYLYDLTSMDSYAAALQLREEIDEWTADFSSETRNEELLCYRHSAMIYLNEPLLHTPTNKITFSSPPHASKVAETDFPSPVITPRHVTALYSLKESCHSLLDSALNISRRDFMAICPLPYAGMVWHALLILAKLHVSVTAPGNTYGAILRAAELRLEQYLERVTELTASVERCNPGSYNGPIFACHFALKDWLKTYNCKDDHSTQEERNAPHSGGDGLNKQSEAQSTLSAIDTVNEDDWSLIGGDYAWINDLVPEDISGLLRGFD